MSVPEYSAGDWTAIVRPGLSRSWGPDAAEATVRALWQETGEGVFAALALLARDGFAGLPPFALVSVDKRRVHAALRGDVEVVVEIDGRLEDVLRSGEVSTWILNASSTGWPTSRCRRTVHRSVRRASRSPTASSPRPGSGSR